MNVRLLIQQAYRWAEILAETGETASSSQLTTGLNILNKILRRVSIDGIEIPLITSETFTLSAGQNTFDLDNWTRLLRVQYDLGNIKMDLQMMSLNDYRNGSRVINTTGIPYIAYPKRTSTGITLEIFCFQS